MDDNRKKEFRRKMRIAVWKLAAIAGFILWCFLMYLDPRRLSEESFLSRMWFVVGLIVIVMLFVMSVYFWKAQIQSPKVEHCQGVDTWDPAEAHKIKPVEENGKIISPGLLVVGVGGVKALQVYWGGKFERGVHIILDAPGVRYRVGSNLVINTDVRETYIGKLEHEEIFGILERLNRYILGKPGLCEITDETPIYVYGVPREDDPRIIDAYRKQLASIIEIERYYKKEVAQLKKSNASLRTMIDEERVTIHGRSAWERSTATKGVPQHEQQPQPE